MDITVVMPCCNSGSIQYGLGILQSIQNETKSLKKSLKVIGYPACNWFLCFQQLYRYRSFFFCGGIIARLQVCLNFQVISMFLIVIFLFFWDELRML